MKSFLKSTLAGLIGSLLAIILIILLGIGIIVGIASSKDKKITVKEKSVLHLEFNEQLSDRSGINPNFQTFEIDKKLGISEITKLLEDAAEDKNVTGVLIEPSVLLGGLATIEEIRNALLKFKESEKFIVAYADYYTHKSYYLASTADKIYLNPAGELQFTGLSAQIMFFKSMLEKIGVEPVIIRHGKFKSAVEPFMMNSMSEANREQTIKYVGSLWNSFLKGISKQRGISIDRLNTLADSLYISSSKMALEHQMVDGLLYKDEVTKELKKLTETKQKKELRLLTLKDYSKAENRNEKEEAKEFVSDKIAVIYVEGNIVSGESSDGKIGSKSLAKEIKKARKDSSVKAIVLRVNSPGGSALASEVIWRETVLAQKEKPFIISMGDVAASGGYYIACAADTIVAQPNTITGSIGVFGLLFNTEELMNTIGINADVVTTNSYSDIGNPARKMTDYERETIQNSVEGVYDTFITHVAKGRNMTKAQVDAIGQGRVWSGEDALEIGLVDVHGGLNTAIQIAKEKAGDGEYRIKAYPEKEKFEKMMEEFSAQAKVAISKEQTGFLYKYIKKLSNLNQAQGIQARLPYFIEIN
ncbi:MAG: signal peptide peptidase SppA [Bacteroidota bacterium]|nr:signal peptide peptidase SppA [Bacteroidota bacterium]